ncbi:MAG: protoporphyrinogen oxidase [Phycisphaerales bacterium]|nr:MAG: protoporphyrinogen oxidase [Phycisphaerales bacterium]
MDQSPRDVIVVGGGISGLTVAWHLARAGVGVTLLEADHEVGGCMRSEHRDGFLLEKGPFNVIVRDESFEELLTSLSDQVQVVAASKAARARYIYRNGRLIRVPTNPAALVSSPLLSFEAKCRLLRGVLASRRGSDADYTIEDFAVRRLGQEVSDTLVSAAIAGILAGDIRKLSLRACFPSIWSFDRRARSPLAYALGTPFRKKKGGKRSRRWRGLVSIDRGLGALAEAAGKDLGEGLVTGCRVEALSLRDNGFGLTCVDDGGAARSWSCRRLVMALPAADAGRLLGTHLPEVGSILDSIVSAPLVVLNLAFKAPDVGHPMQGFGFLVPHNEPDFPLMGVLWADSAFPHHGRVGHRLIRVFIGGTRTPEVLSRSDDELLATASGALRELLQITGEPTLVDVCRYPAAIPQYHLGYVEKIERLRAAASSVNGLHLAGNYLEGVSINDCVRLGRRVAREIIDAR